MIIAKKTCDIIAGFLVMACIMCIFLTSQKAFAYEIKDAGVDVNNDIVLEPAKIEVFLDPGASETKTLRIINRTTETKEFNIDIEDFTGSKDPSKPVVLLGEEKGPYSLKDYFFPELKKFTLKSKEQMTLPITISIPKDAEPGGLYGSILVSSASVASLENNNGAGGGVTAVSRLGALFFVRVNGKVNENGNLESFKIVDSKGKVKKIFSENEPMSFEFLFRNNGNIHLNPYGFITIRNLAGAEISKIEIQPYFAMPDSLRYRKIDWKKNVLMGRYKATASVNRGYNNTVDELSVTFWVIPWKIVLAGFVALFLIAWLFKWILGHFEIRKK